MKTLLTIALLLLTSCSEGPLWERYGGTLNPFWWAAGCKKTKHIHTP